MKNSSELWGLYQTAKSFMVRPSELLNVQDRYAAYCLDNACGEFGRSLENELSNIEGKNKKEIAVKSDRVMRRWLDLPARYRDPVKSGHAVNPNRSG